MFNTTNLLSLAYTSMPDAYEFYSKLPASEQVQVLIGLKQSPKDAMISMLLNTLISD